MDNTQSIMQLVEGLELKITTLLQAYTELQSQHYQLQRTYKLMRQTQQQLREKNQLATAKLAKTLSQLKAMTAVQEIEAAK